MCRGDFGVWNVGELWCSESLFQIFEHMIAAPLHELIIWYVCMFQFNTYYATYLIPQYSV